MKESLTARVGRIISGGANLLINALENAAPEAVMEEAVREVDGVIDEVRAELGQVVARKHLASTRLVEESRRHEDLEEKLALALKENREDLAQAAAARQLDVEAQIPVLENTITECGEKEKELEGLIAALQAKKREMQDDMRQLREAQATASSPDSSSKVSGKSQDSRLEQAQSAFDRVYQNQIGLKGRNLPVDGDAAKLAELEELARKNRIQERLQAAKAKLGNT